MLSYTKVTHHEVQNVPGWERWVRRLCDTEDVEIFVTGSSAQLLTRDPARKGFALATLDEKLRQSCRAAGVELYA